MRRLTYSTSARLPRVDDDLKRELGDVLSKLLKLRSGCVLGDGLGNTPGHWAHREPSPHCVAGGLRTRFNDLR